jgi:hypothetical protein
MAVRNAVTPIPLTSISSGSVSGTYAAINAEGLPNACVIIKIVNNSTEDVTVSFDGINDHDYIPTKTASLYNYQTASQPNNFVCLLPIRTTLWVKGTSGTGSIYLVGFYSATNTNV